MEKKLSLKLQSVIDKLHSVLDNHEKLKTNTQVSRPFELYHKKYAKSRFLKFYLGEDIYAILNAEEEHFYIVERIYGEETEREVDDKTINKLLTEIFENGDYVINTYCRSYIGGGSASDPYSADYREDTGEVSGVPLTTVGYKSKSDIEYDKIRSNVNKAKAVLRKLKENNGILVSDPEYASTVPRNFDEVVRRTSMLAFSLLNARSNDIRVLLNLTDKTYSVSTYSCGRLEKGIDDPEINEMLEQIFTDGQYKISTFSHKADYTVDKVIKGKAFEEITHKAIRPVFGKEQSEEQKELAAARARKKALQREANEIKKEEELVKQKENDRTK